MRNLFFLLVLANGFVAWLIWTAPDHSPRGPYSGPGITLVSEVEGASEESPERSSPPADDAASCVAIGPFNDGDEVAAAAASLAADGFEPIESDRVEEIRDGFWVFIDRIDSNEAAGSMLATLEEAGITDAYVINSDSGILISLGVFSQISRAGARSDAVADLGLDATITERRAEVHWVEVSLPGDRLPDLEALQTSGRISRLEQRPCSDGGE